MPNARKISSTMPYITAKTTNHRKSKLKMVTKSAVADTENWEKRLPARTRSNGKGE